ncbi:uncharacterized protein N7496_009185 [Penicillium cataractarum]|uniref:PH domain-containing protein n=1 Tax=Penicillium cataractarum TaxID=2100454 RepID=A0A9W9RNJ6_9EURO|nr:uncharacterized protein N7496_009185 [Penicillium cataractarum]KAJ5363472.1 hypothetical protein N7496_009185 [Penicillium cataractarum]
MSSPIMSDPPHSSPSFGERRGHHLAPLQTNFSRPTANPSKTASSRLQRPRPTEYPSTNGSEGPVPLQSPVKRQTSKSSLRNLFARDKSQRAAAAPDVKLAEIDETILPANPDLTNTTTQPVTVADAPLSPALTSPRSVVSTPTLTSPTTPRPRATLKTSRPRPARTDSKPASQEQYGWKPPPLFQAYPQSYKHECLPAPAMSADAILRLHATTGKSGVEVVPDETADSSRKKREQKERKHLRTLSGTINKVEWTTKIYVLATAGFILQYAGEGKNDRLPESMLQLGPQSVAFASDAIPGKHWVLQISQNGTADNGPVAPEPAKSGRFSRFGFHRSNTRRMAGSFLLIFDNPDSMTSWLTAVRAEIEVRGGPKFTAENHSDDDQEPQLRSKSSARNIVKKDPNRISSLFLQPQGVRSPDEEDGSSVGGLTWQSRRSSYVSVNHQSIIDSRSGSVSTGWTETTGPSNGSDAQSSSFTSVNPPNSPPLDSSHLSDDARSKDVDSTYARSPPTSSHGNAKRQSLYIFPKPQDFPAVSRPDTILHNQSPPNIPDSLVRSASPPAPNFSVPSFSKKFVSRPGPPPLASPPAPLAGVLRRGESIGDFSISSISSPPVSPTYSIASSKYTDSPESILITREPNGRRILRPSNSEDVLSRTMRSAQNAANHSRLPRALSSETSSPPSRPLSLSGRNGLGIQMNGEQPAQSFPPGEPLPVPRHRVSNMNLDQTPQNMTRRKSMPGLAIGPPAAPPPNCPLPKIPSPIAAQPAPAWSTTPPIWSTSPPADRFYQSQQIRGHIQDHRQSGLPSNFPAPPNGKLSKPAARQSRMIQ